MTSTKVRVRFAPSPTGYLHVGGARTALYNYLFAKHHGGEFILRIEDTDQARSTEEAMRMQISDLEWLGLSWDEGPDAKTLKDSGPYGPYRQSQRLEIYKEHAERLLKNGKAYYCFLTDEEIEAQRAAATAAGRPPQVNSPYRDWTLQQALEHKAKGHQPVIRYKVQEKKDYILKDLVRGDVTFPSDMVGDFVMLRSSGMPVYNFCCVVDDALMKITHVLRAEEHLSNTVRQMMLYEAFGYELPQFGHMSIILGPDKQKLSKRHGATSCHEYMQNGFLEEAMNNFVALLGWSSPKAQEILSMKELIEQFDADRLNASPAVFDETKLQWVNATHLRALPHPELKRRLMPFLKEAGIVLEGDDQWWDDLLSLAKTSMHTLKDGNAFFKFLSQSLPEITPEGKEAMSWEQSKAVVAEWKKQVEAFGSKYMKEADFLKIQDGIKDSLNVKGKFLFQPIRVAVIGTPQGAELKQLIPLLTKDQLLKRAEAVLV